MKKVRKDDNKKKRRGRFVRKATNLKYLLYTSRELNQLETVPEIFELLFERLHNTYEHLNFLVALRKRTEASDLLLKHMSSYFEERQEEMIQHVLNYQRRIQKKRKITLLTGKKQIVDRLSKIVANDGDDQAQIGMETILYSLDEAHDLIIVIQGPNRDDDFEMIRILGNIASSSILNKLLQQSLSDQNEELESLQGKLVEAAHKAGMSDIAGSSLHYFGNLMTSVNIETNELRKNSEDHFPDSIFLLFDMLKDREKLNSLVNDEEKIESLNDYVDSCQNKILRHRKEIDQGHVRVADLLETMKRLLAYQTNYIGHVHNENIDLRDLLSLSIRLKSNTLAQNQIEYDLQVDGGLLVRIQKSKMLHVVNSLIENAVEALEGTEGHKRISIRAEVEKGNIVIHFTDTGSGIPESAQIDIFRNGFTTKENQGGFGLHVSANYMTEMSGSLTLEKSSEGETIFKIVLPKVD